MKTLQVDISDKTEEVPATVLGRDRQRILDGLLRGNVYIITRWGMPIGIIAPVPVDARR